MAASVSEAASFEGVDFFAGRDDSSAGDWNFRDPLRMTRLDLPAKRAANAYVAT
jgi:hypothetical protein